MIYDGHDVSLFIDSALRARSAYTGTVGGNSFPLVIGDGFEGLIDDVRIYERALTALDIQALHSLGK
jgi:hypothetical protein